MTERMLMSRLLRALPATPPAAIALTGITAGNAERQ
jgi:hypothetical protein